MREYPTCPHCFKRLEEIDNYDIECNTDEGKVTLSIVGECPLCHKRFQWVERYKYAYFDYLEEMKD